MALTTKNSKFETKQTEIMSVAVRLLNVHGFRGLSMAEIASEVGMTKANLTYYFKRKDELAALCYESAISEYLGMVKAAGQESSPKDRVSRLVEYYLQRYADSESGISAPLAILGDVRALEAPLSDKVIARFGDLLLGAASMINDSESAHSLNRAAARAELVLMQLFWAAAWLDLYSPARYQRVSVRLSDVIINGFSASQGQWNKRLLDRARQTVSEVIAGFDEFEFYSSAIRIINENGFRGASLDRIAEAMDLTKGVIYHKFKSKDQLLAACYERSFDIMWSMIDTVASRSQSAWAQLFELVVAMVEYQANSLGPFLRESSLLSLSEDVRHDILAQWRRIQIHLASMVSDAMMEGGIRSVDPMIAAQAILAGVNAADEINRFAPQGSGFDAAEHCARPLLFGIFYDSK